MRANRLKRCQLLTTKELKSAGHGSVDYKSDLNSGVIVAKWFDNGPVHLASNFVGVAPMASIERWCPNEKKRVEIYCPLLVKFYNRGMGGVNLADMSISLYRIVVKTRRWYIKIFWHCIDICKVNAWILYRHHCTDSDIPKRKQKSLLQFSLKISDTLIHANKAALSESNVGKVGRPKKEKAKKCWTKKSQEESLPFQHQ